MLEAADLKSGRKDAALRLRLSKNLRGARKDQDSLEFSNVPGSVCGDAKRLFAAENPISRAKTGRDVSGERASSPVRQPVKPSFDRLRRIAGGRFEALSQDTAV